ncbi:unnamed protein product [Pleuronectes platessa]|uniref:Uncharacterized protein n=1 Tax=Pleuronectes platessa TaxID=8262 RepID=A0A9N7UJY3_PLEPL|nr:unnamed protein product [Pleuronectes platessa]
MLNVSICFYAQKVQNVPRSETQASYMSPRQQPQNLASNHYGYREGRRGWESVKEVEGEEEEEEERLTRLQYQHLNSRTVNKMIQEVDGVGRGTVTLDPPTPPHPPVAAVMKGGAKQICA